MPKVREIDNDTDLGGGLTLRQVYAATGGRDAKAVYVPKQGQARPGSLPVLSAQVAQQQGIIVKVDDVVTLSIALIGGLGIFWFTDGARRLIRLCSRR